MPDKDDAQQTQIDALKKENQRLTNKVTQLERHTLRYIDNGDGTVTDNIVFQINILAGVQTLVWTSKINLGLGSTENLLNPIYFSEIL